MKPYKDKRFSIAVFDYGEYSYRENLSTITPSELKKFLKSHDLFCDESFKNYAWSEIRNLQEENQKLKAQLEKAESVLKFYSDYKNYRVNESQCHAVYSTRVEDEDSMSGCGGRFAREYFSQKDAR